MVSATIQLRTHRVRRSTLLAVVVLGLVAAASGLGLVPAPPVEAAPRGPVSTTVGGTGVVGTQHTTAGGQSPALIPYSPAYRLVGTPTPLVVYGR